MSHILFQWLNFHFQSLVATAIVVALAFLVHYSFSWLANRFWSAISPKKPKLFWADFWENEKKSIIKLIKVAVWLTAFYVLFSIWRQQLPVFHSYLGHFYKLLARSVLIAALAWFLFKFTGQLTEHYLAKLLVRSLTPFETQRTEQRVRTLKRIFQYIFGIVIVTVAVLLVFENLGLNLKALMATAGIAGLAVGFGGQSLIKDLLNGIFILIEDQYAVGDIIIINGEGGLVENMSLRTTQLRTTEGALITISNGSIALVKNLTSEWARVDFKIGVAYRTDLDKVLRVIKEEADGLLKEMPDKIIEEPLLLGVDEFEDSAMVVRLWIKTKPQEQWTVRRAFNLRLKKRLDEERIEIPFPQRTLWVENTAPLFENLVAKAGKSV